MIILTAIVTLMILLVAGLVRASDREVEDGAEEESLEVEEGVLVDIVNIHSFWLFARVPSL